MSKVVPNLIERQSDTFYLMKNLAAIDPKYVHDVRKAMAEGKTPNIAPTNELVKSIIAAQEKKIKIDKDVIVTGLKNPLFTVMAGFSTRAIYDGLMKQKKTVKNTFIIEPDIEVFKHVVMTEDITDILSNPKIEVIVGCPEGQLLEVMFSLLSKVDKGEYGSRVLRCRNVEFIVDPFQDNKDLQRIPDIYQATVKHINLAMGCSDDQFTRWKMMIENEDIMLDANRIQPLWDKFKQIPAICIGGGPSLQEFFDAVKDNPDIIESSLIIAVDAVLNKLIDEGIKPHIVVRCERKLTNIFKGVTKEKTGGIYYAAYPWTQREFFGLFSNHLYLFRGNGCCMFSKIDHGRVDGGVSSGNACLELAINFGCKNILLTGLDTCFGDNMQTHAGGTQVEFNPNASKDKMTDILCNDGQQRKTIPVWVRCFNEYGQAISRHKALGKKKFNVINTATKGAAIPHTEYRPFGDVLKLFKNKVDIKKMIDTKVSKLAAKNKEEYKEAKAKIKKQALEVKEYCKVIHELVKDSKGTLTGEVDKLILRIQADLEGHDMIEELRRQQPNFNKLWKNVADQYDTNFDRKLSAMPIFKDFYTDVLQLDYAEMNNMRNSLINKYPLHEDSRYKEYCKIMKDWVVKVQYYTDKLLELL